MEQLPLRVRLRDSARFASFVTGDNAEARGCLTDPAGPRVVWIWGRAGVGKTHLLQAACAAAGERGETAAYFELASAPPAAALEGCESLDLVCLDGLDLVASDPQWNAAVFRLYTLLEAHGRLVVATTAPPASLEFTLPDLRSRLLAASVHHVAELDETGLCVALRMRASARGLDLSEDAALYLVHRLPRDTHSLFAVLEHLDQASLVAQRKLTIPFLRAQLEKVSRDSG